MARSLLDARNDIMSNEDVITPMHHHTEGQDFLLASTHGDGMRRVDVDEAARLVAAANKTPGVHEVDQVGRGFSRRGFLRAGTIGAGALTLAAVEPRMAFAATPTGRDLLVVVFLRGAVDWLSGFVPVTDSAYYAARPGIAVPAADTLALSSAYGLNKNMAAIKPLWDAKQVAVVMGTGNKALTRSHFEDVISCQQAAPASQRSGWIGRHLATSSAQGGTFRAISMGTQVATSLTTTAHNAVAMSAVDEFSLYGAASVKATMARNIDSLFSQSGGQLQEQAHLTLAALDELAPVRDTSYTPAAAYPSGVFPSGMRDIARMAKSTAMLEAATIDFDGWDMHSRLGKSSDPAGWFSRNSRVLSETLAAFAKDLGPLWSRTTVVVMSEFGRRVAENAAGGLDHGHGNAMVVLGGGINGGIYGSMPSLEPGNLTMGDVPITVDYRRVLSEVVSKRLGNGASLGTVFPGYAQESPLGIARPAA